MRAIRIAVTGRPGTGKSTLCKKVIATVAKKKKVGGMISGDIRAGKERAGFEIADVATGEKGILAHINQPNGPSVGKYRVNLEDLNGISARAIRSALNSDLIVIDEIAPMELYSKAFISAVEEALRSDKSMLVTLHLRSSHALVERIRSSFELFVLSEQNRDSLAVQIAERFNAD